MIFFLSTNSSKVQLLRLLNKIVRNRKDSYLVFWSAEFHWIVIDVDLAEN